MPLWDTPVEQQQAVLDLNLGGVINLAGAAIPAYCAAKASVAGLIRALAVELGDTGVTANAVSPGSTGTPILTESARLYGLGGAQEFPV